MTDPCSLFLILVMSYDMSDISDDEVTLHPSQPPREVDQSPEVVLVSPPLSPWGVNGSETLGDTSERSLAVRAAMPSQDAVPRTRAEVVFRSDQGRSTYPQTSLGQTESGG